MVYTDSASIKAVQTAINAAGYQPPLVVDGLNGPKTIAGVKWFEGQHGLAQDGAIGPLVMAATIAPTPAQAVAAAANPLAALTSQISALQAVAPSVPSTPAPMVATPVATMAAAPAPSFASVLGLVPSPAPAAAKPAVMAYKPPTPASPLAGNIGGIPIPALIGAAVGAGLGAFGGLVWILAGAAGGGAAGYGFTKIGPGATMHGEEDEVDFCLEADYGCDEPTIVAGEIGVEVNSSTLRG